MQSEISLIGPHLETRANRRRAWLWVVNAVGALLSYVFVYPWLALRVISETDHDWIHQVLLVIGYPLVWLYFEFQPFESYVDFLIEALGLF